MSVHPRALDYTESMLARAIPDESELTAGTRITPGERYGFFTDTSLCIGCKACEVACKQWNNLPADEVEWLGTGYDNTRSLGHNTWRHVSFIEQPPGNAECGVRSAEWGTDGPDIRVPAPAGDS